MNHMYKEYVFGSFIFVLPNFEPLPFGLPEVVILGLVLIIVLIVTST